MRNITKGKALNELVTYRQSEIDFFHEQCKIRTFTEKEEIHHFNEAYERFEHTDLLRDVLMKEQGYLCCYCMSRLKWVGGKSVKIEHWAPQSVHSQNTLSYNNLMAACSGNEGQSKSHQTCDTRKGQTELSFNPSNPAHRVQENIKYKGNGIIYSDNQIIDNELNTVLNLNGNIKNKAYNIFVSNRKAVIDTICDQLNRKPGTRTKAQIQALLKKWSSLDSQGAYAPYCGVAIYFLEKKL